MRERSLTTAVLLTVGSVMLIGSGCGSSNKQRSTQPATTSASQSAASTGNSVTISMGEFFFKPNDAKVASGSVTITAPNTGKVEHELVLLRTNLDPAKLKTEKDGEANEEAYVSPGEIPDVEAGGTGKTTLTLKPGKYVLICNLPGHYKAGMYGRLTVQ